MGPEISERSFEEAIDCGLLRHGPDAFAGDVTAVRETPPESTKEYIRTRFGGVDRGDLTPQN